MRAYHFTETIARPPEQVWSVLTDLSVAPRWRPLIVSMETVDGGPLRVGNGVRIVSEYLGQRAERVSVTTALEPNQQWTLRSSQPSMEGWFGFALSPEAGGTRVVATCELKAHTFLTWLFLPLIARGERTRRVEMLASLKRVVERG